MQKRISSLVSSLEISEALQPASRRVDRPAHRVKISIILHNIFKTSSLLKVKIVICLKFRPSNASCIRASNA